ncbi:hypothetical protein ACQB6R_09275 [Propionibacteriaceae bacterium G1746]|uniref:hypothetical protein n=1 Tax=Aestuariimicrobium sp. G57 TaxID=3418485 RepID=UPI003C28EA81
MSSNQSPDGQYPGQGQFPGQGQYPNQYPAQGAPFPQNPAQQATSYQPVASAPPAGVPWGGGQPPQQPYPQQQGYPPQQQPYGGPQQQFGSPPPYQPQPTYGAGGGGQPPRKKVSNGMVIGLIVIGILVASGIGALVSTMGKKDAEVQVSTSPSASTTASPTSTPSTTTSPTTSSPSATPSPTAQGGTLTLAGDVTFTIPAGWKLTGMSKDETTAEVTDADGNTITLQVFPAGTKTSNQWVDDYMAQMAKKLTKSKKDPVKKLNDDPKLDVSEGHMSGTRTNSSGSQAVGVNTVIAVRGADKVSVMSTLIYDPRSDLDKLSDDYSRVTRSGMRSLAAG